MKSTKNILNNQVLMGELLRRCPGKKGILGSMKTQACTCTAVEPSEAILIFPSSK